jgi:hypothetical protein
MPQQLPERPSELNTIRVPVSVPKLGDDRKSWLRYNAACAAALAAGGQGTDDPKLDDAARARLQGEALDLL